MGNSKSKQRLHAGHEKLNENDQRYFAKVQARNSTTRPARRFRKPHPVIAMKSCVSALTSIEPPREDGDDNESTATDHNSPKSVNSTPYVGPLPPKIKISDDLSTSSSFSRVNPTLSSISEGKASPTSVVLPSPKGHFTFHQGSSRQGSLAKRRLEKARANQIRPADSFPSDISIVSSRSSTSHAIQDYYTEMLDEAHRESQLAEEEGKRDASRTFDSMLPNGMVWAEIMRGGRVTAVSFSRCDLTNKAMKYPLLMAIGTSDGTVAVVEIMDVPSSPLHKQIEFGSNQSRKVGAVKELPREGTVRSVNFSPDGRWLIVAGDDCMACLLRIHLSEVHGLGLALSSVEMVQEFEREDRVYCVQFSPDGSRVALGGYDGIIAFLSIEAAERTEETAVSQTHPLVLRHEIIRPGLILSVDWSPNGNMLAVGGSHKCCILVDPTSAKVIGEIQRSASVEAVKWKPDGKHVAIGSSDGVVAVVNVESQKVQGEIARGRPKEVIHQEGATMRSFFGGSCKVNALCWSPDGHFLAIAGSDNCCAIVETEGFAVLHEIRRSNNVTCVDWKERRLLTGDNGRYLAIGGEDYAVAIMKTGILSEEEESGSVTESDTSAASSSYFSIGSGSLSQHEWVLREDSFRDVDEVESFSHNMAPLFSPLDNANVNAVVGAVSFSRHRKGSASQYMAIAYSNGCVTIISTVHWCIMKQLTFGKTIKTIHFSRKSDLVALGGDDGTIYIICSQHWTVEKEIKMASSAITALRFSRRDERLAVGSSDGIVALMDPSNDWKIVGEIETSDVGISCIDWSSRHLAVARFDGTISVYEGSRVLANFFLPEAELARGGGPVHALAFGVGGQFLAVGDANGKVGIYSAKGGWVLCHQLNTPSAVLAAKWSSSGQYLAFGGEQQEMGARVVDTVAWTSVKEMHKLDSNERFSMLDWSNDDKWMVLACRNGALHVIDTIDWRPRKSFPGLSIVNESGMKTSTKYIEGIGSIGSTKSGTGTNKCRAADKSDLRWRDVPQVHDFLAMSELFLAAHRDTDPTHVMHPLLKCVLMLTIHVKWVGTKDSDLVRRISRVDDGQPAAALFWILGLSTDIMKQAMRQNAEDSSFWTSFGLDPRDLRRIQAWNEQWRMIDSNASCVDISLLQDADGNN